MMTVIKIRERKKIRLARSARKFSAHRIFAHLKFCNPWSMVDFIHTATRGLA